MLSTKDFAGISEQHCFKTETKCATLIQKINRLDSFVSFSDPTGLLRRLFRQYRPEPDSDGIGQQRAGCEIAVLPAD
jgi:hypothetical protein